MACLTCDEVGSDPDAEGAGDLEGNVEDAPLTNADQDVKNSSAMIPAQKRHILGYPSILSNKHPRTSLSFPLHEVIASDFGGEWERNFDPIQPPRKSRSFWTIYCRALPP